MSPIGSDVPIVTSPVTSPNPFSSPTGLDHARDFAGQSELPETDPAQIEFAQIAARPAAPETPVAMPNLEL
jgi:hypothetical protein